MKPPSGERNAAMIGLPDLVGMAKHELGNRIEASPLRLSCVSCGHYLLSAMHVPMFVRARCVRCKLDTIFLVSEDREVVAVTDSKD